jgi:hypothetical protein
MDELERMVRVPNAAEQLVGAFEPQPASAPGDLMDIVQRV